MTVITFWLHVLKNSLAHDKSSVVYGTARVGDADAESVAMWIDGRVSGRGVRGPSRQATLHPNMYYKPSHKG